MGARKAAIDCTGYRCEMDKAVDLIINKYYRKKAVAAFIELQEKQERDWQEWRDEFGLPPDEDGRD